MKREKRCLCGVWVGSRKRILLAPLTVTYKRRPPTQTLKRVFGIVASKGDYALHLHKIQYWILTYIFSLSESVLRTNAQRRRMWRKLAGMFALQAKVHLRLL